MASIPNFFIVRPDTKRATADGTIHIVPGPIVPLIAVDELPEWFSIVEVPRELAVEQTIGLCNLGTASRGQGIYTVKIIHHAPVSRSDTARVKSEEAKQDKTASPAHLAHPADHPSAAVPTAPAPAATSTPHPADRMRAHWSESPAGITSSIHNPQPPSPYSAKPPPPSTPVTTAITTNNAPNNNIDTNNSTPPIPTLKPDPDPQQQTEYCRHWCHHGTCKWGPHCRHQHAMPATPAALAAVGLRAVPAWWVATFAGTGPPGVPHHHHRQHHPHHHHTHRTTAGHHHHQQQHLQAAYFQDARDRVLGRSLCVDGEEGVGGVGGGAGGGTERGTSAMDPRDVGVGGAVMRPVGAVASSSAASSSATSSSSGGGGGSRTGIHPGPLGGRGQGMSRERVVRALLRELGLTGTGIGTGGGGRFVVAPRGGGGKARKGGVNPLEKGKRGDGGGGGGGVEEREGLLRAARADMAVAAAAAAAAAAGAAGAAGVLGIGGGVGQGQSAVVGAVREEGGEDGTKEGDPRGGKGVEFVQEAVAQKVGKLVDV